MAVGQAPAASILAPAASILAPARILQYFQYTGKRYQYTVLAPLEQPVQHTRGESSQETNDRANQQMMSVLVKQSQHAGVLGDGA